MLNHPITLACGHSVSSRHVQAPHHPPPDLTGIPIADVPGVMERHQAAYLALWTRVPCPISTCKNYLPPSRQPLALGPFGSNPSAGQSYLDMAQSAQQPCPTSLQQDANADRLHTVQHKGPMDVTLSKLVTLVWSQVSIDAFKQARSLMIQPIRKRAGSVTTNSSMEDEDPNDRRSYPTEDRPGDSSKVDLWAVNDRRLQQRGGNAPLADGSEQLGRSGSKRCRRGSNAQDDSSALSPPHKVPTYDVLDHSASVSRQHTPAQQPHHDRYLGSPGRFSANNHRTPSVAFEKELAAILECDVCAQLLYEPITTPCQHVSFVTVLLFFSPFLSLSGTSLADASV